MNFLSQHRTFTAKAQKILKKGVINPLLADQRRISHMMGKKAYPSWIKPLGLDQLNHILHINTQDLFIEVEPGITMEALVDAVLPYGLMPPVVPEFKKITVGGAINGAALESSSHLYGQFNDICLSFEILTADGEVLIASPTENKALFFAFASSYGTLGFLLSVKIQLIEIKPWMHLNYRTFTSTSKALDFLSVLHNKEKPPLVMEALVFQEQKTVVIYGNTTTKTDLPRYKNSSYSDNWFYAHVSQAPNIYEEVVALKDYLFRHDRGAFWMGGYLLHPAIFFKYGFHKIFNFLHLSQNSLFLRPNFCTPKNPGSFFRSIFGGLMSSHTLYKSLHHGSEEWFKSHLVIQDFYLPKSHVHTFISYVLKNYKITPLWICPIRPTLSEQIFSPHQSTNEELIFDVGVYGIPFNSLAKQAVKALEDCTHNLNGRKMLYSATYIDQDQFWKIYPEKPYRDLRDQYHAEGIIPDITLKVLHS